jgi:hypothetical protein
MAAFLNKIKTMQYQTQNIGKLGAFLPAFSSDINLSLHQLPAKQPAVTLWRPYFSH